MGASAGVLSRTGPRLGRRRPPAAATDRPKDNDPEKYIKDPFDVKPVNSCLGRASPAAIGGCDPGRRTADAGRK